MNLLFIHQNFPGQYKHLAQWLGARGDHRVVALSQRAASPIPGVTHIRYAPHHGAAKDAYALSRHWEDCAGAGFAVVEACRRLEAEGFRPDLVLGHVGWGELTFLKQLWPDVPVLGYFE